MGQTQREKEREGGEREGKTESRRKKEAFISFKA